MKNIDDLRNHLFSTLEDLRDKDKPMEINRAQTIAQVAQVIVNSAKVENEYMKITGEDGSGFVPQKKPKMAGLGEQLNVTRHRLR